MITNETITTIERSLQNYSRNFKNKMQEYHPDLRKDLLIDLTEQLCTTIACHVRLIAAEQNGRFLISQADYHELLEGYLVAFREIKLLPRERPKSIYEIRLISSLDTIVKSHCEGEEVE